jgi:hypothetical protein
VEIVMAKKTIEDPPEYSAASGEPSTAAHSSSLDKMPPWSIPAAENVAGGSAAGDIQGAWNSGDPGGVAIEDRSKAAPSGSDAVTQGDAPHASEATMRYNPRYSAEDRAEEDPPVADGSAAGQSSETSDDKAVTSEAGHVASGGIGGITNM